MRRAVLISGAAAAAAAGFLAVWGLQRVGLAGLYAAARPNALIAPLLPHARGETACFAGTFSGQSMDVEDWSKARLVPLDRLSPDGKPYMRNEPPVLKGRQIKSFTLQLLYDDRKSDYDWIYNFRLVAHIEDIGETYAAGECPWFAGGTAAGRQYRLNVTELVCGIDCDGGGFELERVAGTDALAMQFDPRIGLRMKGGCGGGGAYSLRAAGKPAVFRLEKAAPATCRHLEDPAKR
jgi:hypothetical protein